VSDPHPAKPTTKERDDTDASLLAERIKTDAELVRKRTSAEEDEDHLVRVARGRAEQTLGKARELADLAMAAAGTPRKVQKEVEVERTLADKVVAEERTIAEERLRMDRAEHQRALSALLRLEREATDDGLLVERSRADEVVATRDDFLGIVSHDLRNILGTIAMSAEILARRSVTVEGGGAATRAETDRIQRGTARMNRLVGDLLDVVSLEAGELRVTLLPHDAVQLVKEAVETFQPSFSAKQIVLAADVAADPIVATFDHDRILQVLANLLSNALKFTEPGGRVVASVTVTGSEVRFAVTDTGVGIPADQTEAIFERFGQVKRDRRGHGLGLYISKCIVEAHGGRIWAERLEGGGTALRFTLPVAGVPRSLQRSRSLSDDSPQR
jgi:signal transduction histidine kinase